MYPEPLPQCRSHSTSVWLPSGMIPSDSSYWFGALE